MISLKLLCSNIGIDFEGKDIEIEGINTLKDAKKSEISFLSDKKYASQLPLTKAAAVIILEDNLKDLPSGVEALVVKENTYLYMAKATQYFAPKLIDFDTPKAIIGEGTFVAENAYIANGTSVGKNCHILPGAYIGSNCTIGDGTIIHANVSIYRDTVIGNDCIIHSGTVIGSDGFGFAHTAQGEHVKIYQNGNVVIEDSVEIGANCSIDSAVFGSTTIRKGAKLDNLIQIGHNCDIGEHSIIVSQSGVAGSTKLGRNVVVGGQAATAGHLEIAPFTTLASRTGVTKSIKESGKTFAGFPMMEHRQWLKLQGRIASLLKK